MPPRRQEPEWSIREDNIGAKPELIHKRLMQYVASGRISKLFTGQKCGESTAAEIPVNKAAQT